ncbi:MAG TPA: hypothetical protein VF260_10210 [Bacilli bacterium]
MRGLKWLTAIMASAVVATCVSLYTAYVMVNWYAGSFLQSLNLTRGVQKFELSDFLAHLTAQPHNMAKDDSFAQPADGPAQADTPSIDGENRDGSSALAGNVQESDQAASDNAPADDALPVFGSGGLKSASESESEKTLISAEELLQKKDSMSSEDKMKIFSLLVSKLPPEDMQKISGLMEDGVTEQELDEINQLVEKSLTEEEYKQVTEILKKY